VGDSPDLLVNFYPGFRVSWKTAVGGFSNALLEDNLRHWSGDHIVDPEAVPGILFINRAVQNPQPAIVDLAPSILSFLGVPRLQSMDGVALF